MRVSELIKGGICNINARYIGVIRNGRLRKI